jgi:hypothetical protein
MIDTSMVRVHQHGACIADGARQALGRSRGGLTTKLHAVVNAKGLPLRLEVTPGEAHDNRLCKEPSLRVAGSEGNSGKYALKCLLSRRHEEIRMIPVARPFARGAVDGL